MVNVFDINDESPFHPSTAVSGEFEVGDLLDHHIYGQKRFSEWKFLVKWRGYLL